MPFDFARYIHNIDTSFQQGGAYDLRDFIFRNPTADKWVIASDFNTCSPGASQDVYSFACYPVDKGLEHLRSVLTNVFPKDFKETSIITREQKRFFREDICFCFVFFVSRKSKFLRTGDTKADLIFARRLLDEAIAIISKNGAPDNLIKQIKALRQDASKNSFSLYLFERILLLSMFTSYVSMRIAANTIVEHIGWFPDRDDMTTYADGVFNALSYINFQALWSDVYPHVNTPPVRLHDRRISNKSLDNLTDELIRVPDFLSAVLSRWDLEKNKIKNPGTAKRAAMNRYLNIIRHWQAGNSSLWIGNTRLEDGDLKTGRIVTATSLKKLNRYKGNLI